tara:strand:+ start:2013 stop:2174 length:162 start_codon:yes stop_codon:yes gene_type:complete
MENPEDRIGIGRRVRHDLGGRKLGFLLQDESQEIQAVAQRSGNGDRVQAGELV